MVTLVVIIQTALNSTDSGGKNIIVTWLESNKTNANSTPTIKSNSVLIEKISDIS